MAHSCCLTAVVLLLLYKGYCDSHLSSLRIVVTHTCCLLLLLSLRTHSWCHSQLLYPTTALLSFRTVVAHTCCFTWLLWYSFMLIIVVSGNWCVFYGCCLTAIVSQNCCGSHLSSFRTVVTQLVSRLLSPGIGVTQLLSLSTVNVFILFTILIILLYKRHFKDDFTSRFAQNRFTLYDYFTIKINTNHFGK